MNGALVGTRVDRALRGKHANATRAGGLNRGASARLDHADDRNLERALDDIETGGRGGVARDDDELDVMALEPAANLAHE